MLHVGVKMLDRPFQSCFCFPVEFDSSLSLNFSNLVELISRTGQTQKSRNVDHHDLVFNYVPMNLWIMLILLTIWFLSELQQRPLLMILD